MKPTHKNPIILLLLLVFSLINGRMVSAQDVAALPPGQLTIIQYIMDDRPVLASLLTTAGLVPVLSGNAPYTLLAPPEQALASLKNESPDKVRNILSGYILKGKYLETDLKDGASVETLNGNKIKICRKDGTMVNGVLLTKTNQEVRNGVIHQLKNALN